YGSAFLPAIDLDGNAIFIQRGLRKVRRLEYEYSKDRYKAIDITILSNHITESGLTDVAYSDEPNAYIWGVRTDGQLVCLTYEPEYGVFGWSRQIVGGTDALVKSIAVSDAITADEDELWVVIERTVNSNTVQYVEFLKQGLINNSDIEDAFFIDSGVTKTGTEQLIDGGLENWTGNDLDDWIETVSGSSVITDETTIKHGGAHSCKATIDGAGNNVGIYQSINYVIGEEYTVIIWLYGDGVNQIRIMDDGAALGALDETVIPPAAWTKYEFTFTANANSNTMRIQRSVSGETSWAFYIDDISVIWNTFKIFDGLTHLIGETVQVFADGLVQATKVVNGSGEITITAADKAHVGLAYDSTIETLPLEGGNPIGSAMGKIKRITNVVLRLYNSLAFTIGGITGGSTEDVDLGTSLFTDDTDKLDFYGDYEIGGQMKITITDPVPFTLLAIMYEARTRE
ncbi:MAG: carbohydrate binding domain-containing protein, partial [Gammaproteobacteria bacterium]|nr:carbohydrate binding domain-containing protein [Gammaproteobacteria bacterium]